MSPLVVSKLPRGPAVRAYTALQHDIVGYELIRLGAAWDPVGTDRASIPTILALMDSPAAFGIWLKDLESAWDDVDIASNGGEFDEEVRKLARTSMRAEQVERIPQIIGRLHSAANRADRVVASRRLKAMKDWRHNNIAHNLVPDPRKAADKVFYGDLGALLFATVSVVRRLHLSLNDRDMDFQQAFRGARRHSKTLWSGTHFSFPDHDDD